MTSPRLASLQSGQTPNNSLVLRDQKIVYLPVAEVACTALRSMVADLSGFKAKRPWTALGGRQTQPAMIRREGAHLKTLPRVSDVPAREHISRDNSWLIFAVVRDPWSRLWSAWQSKLLVRDRHYVEKYGSETWFPRVPEKAQDVIHDFRAFVDASPWLTNRRMVEDLHFLPQVRSVHPDNIEYPRVYDLHHMPMLIADIHTHLKTVGKDKNLHLHRGAEIPLPLIPRVLENGVAEQIAELYHADFNLLGDSWNLERVEMEGTWTTDAIRFAAYCTIANERTDDLEAATAALLRQLDAANAEISQLWTEKLAHKSTPARTARRLGAFAIQHGHAVKRRLALAIGPSQARRLAARAPR